MNIPQCHRSYHRTRHTGRVAAKVAKPTKVTPGSFVKPVANKNNEEVKAA